MTPISGVCSSRLVSPMSTAGWSSRRATRIIWVAAWLTQRAAAMGWRPHLVAGWTPWHEAPRSPRLRWMRDADNELYDCSSELVEAAAGMRRAAGHPDAAPALPSALACIEDALGNLARMCAGLELARLSAALEHARRASGDARALAARRPTRSGAA